MESKNTFSGALNTDLDNNVIPSNTYKEGKNITIFNDDGYLSVQNIKGASVVKDNVININELSSGEFNNDNISILGGVRADFRNNNTGKNEDSIVFFYIINDSGNYILRVKAYLMESDSVILMFSETYTDPDYKNASLDFYTYGEGGYDNIYFTVGVGSIKKIICNTKFSGLGEYECVLERHMPLGGINNLEVLTPDDITEPPQEEANTFSNSGVQGVIYITNQALSWNIFLSSSIFSLSESPYSSNGKTWDGSKYTPGGVLSMGNSSFNSSVSFTLNGTSTILQDPFCSIQITDGTNNYTGSVSRDGSNNIVVTFNLGVELNRSFTWNGGEINIS